jgi:CHAT domain-containing protein
MLRIPNGQSRAKVAELKEYFKDNCVDAFLARTRPLETVSPTTAIVYPISLQDRMELLVSLPISGQKQAELKRFVVPVGADSLAHEVKKLRRHLENYVFPEKYLPYAKKLYDWLIRPLEPALTRLDIDTLIFVPDGPLRMIPMAVLHDGQEFLIRKYALATTPGLTMIDPRPVSRGNMQVLAAGLAVPIEGFAALHAVIDELIDIQGSYGGTLLLDEDFRLTKLENALRHGRFGIVHIASHGQF